MKKFFVKSVWHCILALALMQSVSSHAQINSSGLLFDGVDDYISIPHIPAYNIGTGDFTIEMWVRIHQYQVGLFTAIPMGDLFNYNNNTGTGISIIYTYNSNPAFALYIGSDFYSFSSGFNADNLCHHLAFVRAGTTVTFYLDGVIKSTIAHGAAADIGVNTIPINVGGGVNSSGRFTGFIHEIRFWNIARSQANIQSTMNTMLAGNEPGLIGYWKCNDFFGQVINDFSPSNNDGTRGSSTNSDTQDPQFITGCSNCALPSNTTITAGGPTTVCDGVGVTLSAPAGLYYYWTFNWAPPPLFNNQFQSFNTAGIHFSAIYQCVLGNECGNVLSNNTISVTVVPNPTASITAGGPTNFCGPGSVTLNANTGTGLTYQWRLNGVDISGATTDSYIVNNTTGNYSCVVSSAGCSTTSNTIAVSIPTSAPVASITAGGSTTFCSGGSVTLSATTGSGFTYQWRNNTVNISGATNTTYNSTTSGSIDCIVTNVCGSTTTNAIVVTVNPLPVASITAGGPTTFCSPGSVTLSAQTAAGNSYQWQLNNSNISGATSSSYIAVSSGTYRCIVTNAGCSATSNTIAVTVNSLPPASITALGPLTFCSTGVVILSANTGTGLTYQWRLNNTAITGATATTFAATSAGNYDCLVTNTCGSTTSNTLVTIISGPCADGLLFSSANTTRVTIPHHTAYDVGTGSFTIEAWINATSALNTGFRTIVSNRSNGFNGFRLYISNGKLRTRINSYTSPEVGSTITNNICHHVAITRSGNSVNFYIDGVFVSGQFLTNADATTIHDLWIGNDEPEGGPLNGMIHEVRIWNVVRTQTQLQAAKDISLTGAETGLVGYWRMNDGSGQTVQDFSPSANGGVLGSTTSTESIDPVFAAGCIIGPCTTPSSISAGGPTTFCAPGSVVLNANTGPGLTYQWQLNNVNISGATVSSYTATSGGNYRCIVSDGTCSTTSNLIVVIVHTTVPPAIINAGGSTTFCSPGSVTLSANTGTGLTYQWRQNTSPISGATNSSYVATASGSYDCIVGNSCGNATSNSIPVTVNVTPTASITAGGSTTFCSPGSVTLNANTGAGLSYQWRLGGSPISGATSSSYVASSAGNYDCVVSNTCGSATSNSIAVTVNTSPSASITAGGSTTFCAPGSVTLNANTGTGLTYQWRQNTSPISGATNNSYVATTGGNYDCIVSNVCGSVPSNSIAVTVNTLPPATISAGGSTTFCSPGSVTLNANTGAGLTYQWRQNTTTISGETNSSYVATTGGNYDCVVSNVCGSVTSNSIAVTVNTLPTATISAGGSTTFCSPGSVTLNANTGSGLTYQWRQNTATISGATNSSYVASTAGNYDCVVSNVCGSVTSNSISVTVNTLPTATISAGGSTTFCSPGSVALNANTGTGLTYQWRQNTVNITGATNSSYVATAGGSYTCVVSNICGNTTSNAIVVTVNNIPAASITAGGSTTFCSGGSVTLNANTGTGLTYQWRLNSTGISGATLASYNATTAGTYDCIISNNCGSSTSNSIAVTVNVAPTATIIAGGPTTFCTGGSVTLNANTGGGLTYQWKLNGGTISGATLSSYSANATGNYTCIVSNNCGGTTSNTIAVTVNTSPSTPGAITGQASGVCSSTKAYSIAAVPGATSYTWTPPAGATIASGQGTTTANITFTGAFSGGLISVVTVNSCGSSAASSLSVTGAPAQPGSITGPVSVCHNQNNVVYSIVAVAGATSYTWTAPPGTQIKTGQGSTSIKVRFGNSAGNITVKANNACGSSAVRSLAIAMPCKDVDEINPEPTFEVRVFPNPSSNEFTFVINNTEKANCSLKIVDLTGRVVEVHEHISTVSEFKCGSALVNGIYFAEIISGENKKVLRLIKDN